jgi:hypothetical protein
VRTVLFLLSVIAVGCGDDVAGSDGGGSDAGDRPDGGADGGDPRDAGSDAARRDAGPIVGLCDPGAPPPGPFPDPGAFPPNRGPGGPARPFTAGELYTACAYLDGGPMDTSDHHNLVTMLDGYLLMPWAPEYSGGGLTFWDVSDPCNPRVIGTGYSAEMRETHAIGFSTVGGRWAVVDQMSGLLMPGRGGIEIWDVSDPTAPAPEVALELPGFIYPDAYARVTLSVFWQVPHIYVGGADNGVYIVDASDPRDPRLVDTYEFEPTLRVGQVQAIGNLLVVTTAEGARTALLDISDPVAPMPIPGGDFQARDRDGDARDAYFTNFAAGHVWYANKDSGGGLLVWDVRDPTMPRFAGDMLPDDGNGGYVFVKDGFAFTGESSYAAIYDVSDLSNIREVTRLHLSGDLDTNTPIGNVAVLSVDDESETDQASAVVPWQMEPDGAGPRVTWSFPADGASRVPLTSRIGLTFSEFVDAGSAFPGSVRLYRADGEPDAGRVATVVSAQEVIVNVHPLCPLEPGVEYVLEVPAGGVTDFNGNAVVEPFRMTFTTVGE